MPRLTIDITDELANELLSRRVDAVGVCLTALRDAVNGSGLMPVKLTRQGVRDLGSDKKRRRSVPVQCDHRRLRSCCYKNGRGCGHILCPDCDLYIDVGAELNGKWRW